MSETKWIKDNEGSYRSATARVTWYSAKHAPFHNGRGWYIEQFGDTRGPYKSMRLAQISAQYWERCGKGAAK